MLSFKINNMKFLKYSAWFIIVQLLYLSCDTVKPTGSSNKDILITGGTVFTGESIEGSQLNLLISGDTIAYIGSELPDLKDSAIIIDASGLIVAPGFIDPHTHALEDLDKEETSHNLPFLHQGVTTVVTGSDGRSPIPITSSFERWQNHGIGTNALMLVGHGQVRLNVIGDDDREPTQKELSKMKELVRKGMEDGAFGISTGLYYAPGFFAETEEVIELSKVVAEYGGIYDTHQRDESSYTIGLLASVEEVIRIGREAKLPVHISHIKGLGADVWDKSHEVIALIEKARNNGVEITANQYPYNASGTSMMASTFPRWANAGGKDEMMKRINSSEILPGIKEEMRENIRRRGGAESLLLINPENPEWRNKTLMELSSQWSLSPTDAALKVITEGGSGVASFNMNESDINNFMKQTWVVTGSDGSINHPRKYGTFPRKIGKYALKDSVITLGEAINRSTSRTAEIFRIPNRGQLIKGYYADIVIFNPKTIIDKAWFNNPEEFSEGVHYVIVNGEITINQGNWMGNKAGRVLRKPMN